MVQVLYALSQAHIGMSVVTQKLGDAEAMNAPPQIHPDISDQPDRLGRAFWVALALHVAVVGGFVASNWIAAHTDTFGAKDAGGGAVGIQTVEHDSAAESRS